MWKTLFLIKRPNKFRWNLGAAWTEGGDRWNFASIASALLACHVSKLISPIELTFYMASFILFPRVTIGDMVRSLKAFFK